MSVIFIPSIVISPLESVVYGAAAPLFMLILNVAPSNLFLLEGVKNTGKGIKVLKPLIVHDKKNNYSQEIKEIFKI